ncbi:MAG: peptidylprolyl isomerase [Roseibium album]|uniref:peptidylprolyl isomerase n=1 Tax=Effrenium voratum TaxID=2562239 RepID=A0AA36MJY8_9DINO|nr:peptidylprolyl isomerase [Roseibium album]MBG6144499.1 peptidylprolyl isomerase [Labrenzia sp. EL_142]MBG6154260.1 peptidylprolyl isomerase [Labrenzia sp. EL_162]MBG6161544.1 peptidylprolyl isomerase [Labrenzia sp. EL_195]MBG6175129.1 peptidylprolyl isomerase [Labrenzia sp. EL_132]MBG6193611.1 peptidylprolyl isomerase [Labrenzia sp. EL_159]MBG6207437.1 peptidylprolyl isomerase [Labrenzia sp. EL_126]MBG6229741.1 peptidylprolyl isomerase [Labrenzia sp. EL_208]MCR9062036.1 peptidylprolyl is
MTEAKSGDTVQLHYKGTLDDGSVFDSSEGREPLEFTVGSGQIIPGLDREIAGMKVGDEKTVRIEPEDAYGPSDPAARQTVPRATIPANIPLEVGLQLQAQTENGQTMSVTVVEISDDEVVMDANHPLAGKALTFEIQLTGIS